MDVLIQQIATQALNGLVLGMILVLVASGLTLIFGIMDIVNFAHGEFYMAGAFVAWVTLHYVDNFWLALMVAALVVAVMGMAVDFFVLRAIRGREAIYTWMAMFGMSILMQQCALSIFGPIAKVIKAPISAKIPLFAFSYPVYRLSVVAISALIMFLVWLFLQRTKYGTWVRATMQDSVMATAMGIPVKKVYRLTFALGTGMAAASGVLVAPIYSVYTTMGMSIIVSAFIVVVIGGLGSIQGSIIAAILIGELQTLSSVWISPTYARVFCFGALIVVLLIRPQGLFPITKRG